MILLKIINEDITSFSNERKGLQMVSNLIKNSFKRVERTSYYLIRYVDASLNWRGVL